MLVAASALVLAGCGNSAKDMSFDETYDAFWDAHTSDAVEMFTHFADAPALSEEGTYMLSGFVTGGVAANVSIDAVSVVTNEGLDTDSVIGISGSLTQPGLNDTISFNSDILFKMVSGLSYINLSTLNIGSEQGNPQISMLGAFSAILTNKWIALVGSGTEELTTLKGVNLSSLYMVPAAAVESLKEYPIFVETSKEMDGDKPVYHVALSASGLYMVAKDMLENEAVKGFLRGETFTDEELMDWANTFVANASFKGRLIAHSKKDVELTIDMLRLDNMEYVTGTVGKDATKLEVMDDTVQPAVNVATLMIEEQNDKVNFSLTAPSQMLSVGGWVDMESVGSDDLTYSFYVSLSHPDFAADLDGAVAIEKTEPVVVETPSAYQTVDQLVQGFWDILGGSAGGDDLDVMTLEESMTQ